MTSLCLNQWLLGSLCLYMQSLWHRCIDRAVWTTDWSLQIRSIWCLMILKLQVLPNPSDIYFYHYCCLSYEKNRFISIGLDFHYLHQMKIKEHTKLWYETKIIYIYPKQFYILRDNPPKGPVGNEYIWRALIGWCLFRQSYCGSESSMLTHSKPQKKSSL